MESSFFVAIFYIAFGVFLRTMKLLCEKGKGWAWVATIISLPFGGIPIGMMKAGEIPTTNLSTLIMLMGVLYAAYSVSIISGLRKN